MNAEFIEAINAISKEKGIDTETVFQAVETAIAVAYKKNYPSGAESYVTIDRQNGRLQVFDRKQVVEEVEDELSQISLEDARRIRDDYAVGDYVDRDVTPTDFGRIAAKAAKDNITQKIREAERNVIYNEYVDKLNEITTAVVRRVEKKNVYVELGRTEGYLSANEQLSTDDFKVGDRIKVYISDVKQTGKGAQIIVSRTHTGLVKRLFELEVPEIANGTVIIKSISREAGSRTKIAVYTNDPAVDPLGACVGPGGTRVDRIVKELNGEKIDIIRWSEDPAEYIAYALSPARVMLVQTNADEHIARVVVADNQLSLAIGKEGQNARLAARLTGWKIDIKSQSKAADLLESLSEEAEEE
ncbi:MAG: transcription termination/antitermination protein NusA [Eubacteriales bacterium]|nr:transcription termination/antitermination protein NusA [Eubacteriales bacterium]